MTPFWLQRSVVACLLCTTVLFAGCSRSPDGGGGGRNFLSMGTAPVGGAFPVVGGAIAEVLNEHKGENEWKVQAKGTKGSQENIRRLDQGDLELALSNAAITYFAVRGEEGWEREYPVQAIATLAPNVAMFIARKDSGIQSVADLRGKRVVIGPAGAGFEMFVKPIMEAHGVGWEEFTQVNATQSGAVDLLSDGAAEAAFLGGAVPTGSITQAASTFDVTFVPFDEQVRQQLIDQYPFFHPATVPAGTYSGLEEDFVGLNVGSMHLITSADQDEELIYQITKTMWENREEIAQKHPAGRSINEENVARDTGTPFHPGAARFYREIGVIAAEESPSDADTSEPTADPTGEGAASAGDAEASDAEPVGDEPAVEEVEADEAVQEPAE